MDSIWIQNHVQLECTSKERRTIIKDEGIITENGEVVSKSE